MARSESTNRRRQLLTFVVVLAVVATLWTQLSQLHDALSNARGTGDYAIFEINVRRVLDGAQRLGPYSQGFHHPGPAYFQWLAAGYALGGRSAFSLYVAGQLLTTLSVLGCALLMARWSRSLLAVSAFVPLFVLELSYLGDFPLFDWWPPYAMFFVYGFFLMLCGGLAAGRLAALAPTVALASLLVQTHLGYAPAVVIALGVVAAHSIVRRHAVSWAGWKAHVALAAGIAALLWAQPLYAELIGKVGNLQRIRHVFVETTPPAWQLSSLLDRVSLELSGPLQLAAFGDRFIVPEAPKHFFAARRFAAVQVFLLLLAWLRARKRQDRFSEGLCAVCLASIVAAAWSVSRIRGAVAPHHTAWISMLGAVSLVATASGLWGSPADSPRPRWLGRLAAMLTAWAACAFIWPLRIIPQLHENPEVAALASSITDALRREGIQRPSLAWTGGTAGLDWASAILLELEKRGVSFAVQDARDLNWKLGGVRWAKARPGLPVVQLRLGSEGDAGDERQLACVEHGANPFMKYPICAWLRRR